SIGQNDDARLCLGCGLDDCAEVVVEAASDDEDSGAELVERHHHLFRGLRLRHDPHLVFDRQDFGDACTENRLVVGQDEFEDVFRSPPLRITYEFIGVNHAGHTPALGLAPGRFVGANHATPALNHNIILRPSHLGRQSNLELNWRAHFQGGVGTNIDAGSTQVAGYAAGLSARFCFMNFDGQFQRESLSSACFGHSISSILASSARGSQWPTTSPGWSLNYLCSGAVISRMIPPAEARLLIN